MAGTIAVTPSSIASGQNVYMSGSGWPAGQSLTVYVGGQYAGVVTSGPYSGVGYGAIAQDLIIPNAAGTYTLAVSAQSEAIETPLAMALGAPLGGEGRTTTTITTT